MIAQMLWNGDGVKADRVMAYVWADLAAERGYPAFIATREKFWRELSADEQRSAVSAGQAIFDEYGDTTNKQLTVYQVTKGEWKAVKTGTADLG